MSIMVGSPFDKMEWDTLKTVQLIASRMSKSLGEILHLPVPNISSSSGSDRYPDLIFPPHDEILLPLSTMQIPGKTLHAILDALHSRIEQLQGVYTSSYQRACLESSSGTGIGNNSDALHKVYQVMTQRHYLPTIQSWVSFASTEIDKRQSDIIPSKRPFNNHFIPMLLKYFEYNGYPSLSHRTILAEKSGMTLRQIEVWFQNHRKRSKEDGSFVQRLDSDVPLKQALSVLPTNQQSCPLRHMTPSDDETTTIPKIKVINTQYPTHHLVTSCLEETNRPPHAYPTKRSENYPDPFPTDNGVHRFPPPIWRRKPATKPIIPTAVDMDDFARQFHMKLNFINTSWRRESTPSKSNVPSFSPWFAPSRTIPPSAPLTALERPHALAPVFTSMLSSTIAMDPFTFVFPKPRESGQPEQSNVTCIVRLPFGPRQSASSITERIDRSVEALDRERKGFRMRRRALNSPRPSASRLASPGEVAGRKGSSTSRRAPSSLQTFGSRTSSFTSDTSSSSDDSSSPSTPPPLPDQSLLSEPLIEANNNTVDDNFFDFTSSQSFDFTFTPSVDDTQPSSPQSFDFTFTKPLADTQPSALHSYTPLIFT